MSAVKREDLERLGVNPDEALLRQSQLIASLAEVALHATMDLREALMHAEKEIRPPEGKVYTILLGEFPEFSFKKRFENEPSSWVPRHLTIDPMTYFFADRIIIQEPIDGSGIAWTEVFAVSPDGQHRLTLTGDSMITIQDSTEVAHNYMINQHLAKLLQENEERLAQEDIGY